NVARSSPASHRHRERMETSLFSFPTDIDSSRAVQIPSNRIASRNSGCHSGRELSASEIRFDELGVMNYDFRQLGHLIPRQTTRRATDTQAGDDATGAVVDRRTDTTDARLMLALVEGVATGADQSKLALELASVGDRGIGEALQSARDDGVYLRGGLEGE